jgi:hypothetical protein
LTKNTENRRKGEDERRKVASGNKAFDGASNDRASNAAQQGEYIELQEK